MENKFNLKNFNQTSKHTKGNTVHVTTQSPRSGDRERDEAEHSPSLWSVVTSKKAHSHPRYQPRKSLLKELKVNPQANKQDYQKAARALKQENTNNKDG